MFVIKLILMCWVMNVKTEEMIGYDCGQSIKNYTSFSLIHLGECDVNFEPELKSEEMQIGLIQVNDYAQVYVRTCKVEIDRHVTSCNDHWYGTYSAEVYNGHASYIEEISRMQCHMIHETKTFILRNYRTINNIVGNSTGDHPMVFAGTVEHQGKGCSEDYYQDPYGSWSAALVTGHVKITVSDYTADVNMKTHEVILQTGTRCKLEHGQCVDLFGGFTYWDALPKDDCQNKYSTLYVGKANKLTGKNNEKTIYSVEKDDITFAFTDNGQVDACSYDLIKTEHPKLFIIELGQGRNLERFGRPSTKNLDMFTYITSKLVYVEKHIKKQMNRLYHDVILHTCNIERQTILNALALAIKQPDEFGMRLMGESGYMAYVAGEVIYLLKCIPTVVRTRITEGCYQELPVIKDDQELYMMPRTHILTEYGTKTTCNTKMAPMFFIANKWYRSVPQLVESNAPDVLQPQTKPTWKYIDAKTLTTGGVYTLDQMEKLRDLIMFPVEKNAILTVIAKGMKGGNVTDDRVGIDSFLNRRNLEKIAQTTWETIWGKFLIFGNISAGLIGVLIVFRMIKFMADTVIQGYTLYTLYGWSLHILGAVLHSVTQLLIHLGADMRNENNPTAPTAPTLETALPALSTGGRERENEEELSAYSALRAEMIRYE